MDTQHQQQPVQPEQQPAAAATTSAAGPQLALDPSAFVDDLVNAVSGTSRARGGPQASPLQAVSPNPSVARCSLLRCHEQVSIYCAQGFDSLDRWGGDTPGGSGERSAGSTAPAPAPPVLTGPACCCDHHVTYSPPLPSHLMHPCHSSLREQRGAALTPEQQAACLHGSSQLYLALRSEVDAQLQKFEAYALETCLHVPAGLLSAPVRRMPAYSAWWLWSAGWAERWCKQRPPACSSLTGPRALPLCAGSSR